MNEDERTVTYQGEPLFIIEEGIVNRTRPGQPIIITIDEPEAITHEVGHALSFHLTDRFDVPLTKKPSLDKFEEYAVLTYQPRDAAEGVAQSFADYFDRPNFLRDESPELFEFWDYVVEANPEIERVLEESEEIVSEF